MAEYINSNIDYLVDSHSCEGSIYRQALLWEDEALGAEGERGLGHELARSAPQSWKKVPRNTRFAL